MCISGRSLADRLSHTPPARRTSQGPKFRFAALCPGSVYPLSPAVMSVRACFGRRAYVLVAWIWSFIWHLPLDLIKWMMAYVLNEDGFRDRMHGRTPASIAAEAPEVVVKEGEGKPDAGGAPNMARTSAGSRPALGRNSVQVALTS